jgi:hypothetical protein
MRKIIKQSNSNVKPYQYKPSDKTYHETIKNFDEDNDVCNLISISLQADIIHGILY